MPKLFKILFCLALASCNPKTEVIGTETRPLRIQLIPAVDSKMLAENAEILRRHLEKNTPYKFQITIPNSFTKVVEALGHGEADIAGLSAYGYYLAHKKFGVEARLTVIRFGLATYQSQVIVPVHSKAKKMTDLAGKRWAFVDPVSASGYLLPMKILKELKMEPAKSDYIFAMNHDAVVEKVYKREVDAGATYYGPPRDGQLEDARKLIQAKYPDVEKKVRILHLSEPLPNDPIVFRKDVPEIMKEKIVEELLKFAATAEGKKVLDLLWGATNFKKVSDKDYASLVDILQALGPVDEK